jgi:hypothetical protein
MAAWSVRRALAVVVTGGLVAGGVVAVGTPPASAGLLGNVVCPVGGTVGQVLGVLTAGWDDGATTPPTTMAQVSSEIGASTLWSRGVTGASYAGTTPFEGAFNRMISSPWRSMRVSSGPSPTWSLTRRSANAPAGGKPDRRYAYR